MQRTKQKRRRKGDQRHQSGKIKKITEAQIPVVKKWFDRIQDNADKAINLSLSMSPEDVNESTDMFWALVKYAENVHESIVQLDNICKGIYPCLAEIPMEPAPEHPDNLHWDGLKGMRIKLVHQFWEIDPKILWDTVTTNFPQLVTLLSRLFVVESLGNSAGNILFRVEKLLALSPTVAGSRPTSETSIPILYFDYDGNPHVDRIGRTEDNSLVFGSSDIGKRTISVHRILEYNGNAT